METPNSGTCSGRIQCSNPVVQRTTGGSEGRAREDRTVGAGENFFVQRGRQCGLAEWKEMFDRTHVLPVCRQAKIHGINRSSVSYRRVLALMNCIWSIRLLTRAC